MQTILAATAMAVAAAITPTAAAQNDLSGLYGNTVVTVDDGIEAHFYYAADHTFTGKVPAYFFDLKGTWTAKEDGTVCRVFSPPIPRVKNPDCGPIAVRKPGEKKVFDDGDSQKLVSGIQ